MSIPENPQTRSEQYLDAIATGDTSGIPEYPQCRMEQYLDYIAKNGGSGGGGGGGGVLVVTAETDTETSTSTLDKTWQEIHDAMLAGGAVILSQDDGLITAIMYVGSRNSQYAVVAGTDGAYVTDTSDGYPVRSSQITPS